MQYVILLLNVLINSTFVTSKVVAYFKLELVFGWTSRIIVVGKLETFLNDEMLKYSNYSFVSLEDNFRIVFSLSLELRFITYSS